MLNGERACPQAGRAARIRAVRVSIPHAAFLTAALVLLALAGGCTDDGGPAANDSGDDDAGETAVDESDPTAPGEPAPAWALPDFQPASEAFEESYGLEAFHGKATLVAFLSGW